VVHTSGQSIHIPPARAIIPEYRSLAYCSFEQRESEFAPGCWVHHFPPEVNMSADHKPDIVEHSNRGASMFFIRPDISFAGDEEVRRALKCECGGDLHHDKNSLNQVSGLILISRSMTIKSGSHDSKTRDNDIADIADFARGGTCLNSLIFLSLMFLCISLLVLNARFHLLSCSPFFVFRFHFPKESGGFKVIFELGRRPSTMAQAMYQCKTSNCSKTYGATDPHILRSMPRRYFGS